MPKIEVLSKGLSAQKAPTRAAGLAQQARKTESISQKVPRAQVVYGHEQINEDTTSYKSRVHTYSEGITRYIGSTLGIMPISL